MAKFISISVIIVGSRDNIHSINFDIEIYHSGKSGIHYAEEQLWQ